MTSFAHIFQQSLINNNLSEYSDKTELFEKLYTELTETNKHINLTAVTEPEEVCGLHFCDSLTVCKYLGDSKKLLDIGCGAGFPSLPIAIALPQLSVTGMDSTGKKTEFAARFAEKYDISNFKAVNARAEESAKTDFRESFDAVTARAVAKLSVLAEIALPFVRTGGIFLSMKGPMGAKEAEEAEPAVTLCGGKTESIVTLKLHIGNEEQTRTLVLIRKISPTPQKYPRMYSKIVKSPLK